LGRGRRKGLSWVGQRENDGQIRTVKKESKTFIIKRDFSLRESSKTLGRRLFLKGEILSSPARRGYGELRTDEIG